MESCATGAVGVMDILQGIVIGVFSGLTLGGFARLRDYWVRRDQIKYFRELIIKERKTIYSATNLSDPIPIPRDAVRLTIYKDMQHQLSSAVDGRASQLSFDEKRSLPAPLHLAQWLLVTQKIEEKGKTLPLKVYTRIFSDWEQLTWLNLPAYDSEIPEE